MMKQEAKTLKKLNMTPALVNIIRTPVFLLPQYIGSLTSYYFHKIPPIFPGLNPDLKPFNSDQTDRTMDRVLALKVVDPGSIPSTGYI